MSKKHRGEMHEEHMDETWLIPYADLLTLLLALFVILYASSQVDQEKYNAMAEAFYNTIGTGSSMNPTESSFIPPFPEAGVAAQNEEEQAQEMQNLQELQAALNQMLAEAGIEDQVTTGIDDRGLVVSMNDAVLFDSGFADIKPEHSGVLVKIGETINQMNNFIRVEGHTDIVPMHSAVYPTNWELSMGRSTRVVRLFIDESKIPPDKLLAVGYGEFRPIADNATVEGRAKNRRVDIIILSSRFDSLEQPPRAY